MERKLAAILAADVVGFSRLMGRDKENTLLRLKHLLSELVKPQIRAFKGRIVKLMGDGLLAEFPSVVDATECAVAIQRAMLQREPGISGSRRIKLRAGIHLGDIIIDGSDIFGDGVNVAARLETLAEPGAICISEDVYRQVNGKLPVSFRSLGKQELKNIESGISAYSIDLDPARLSPELYEILTGEALELPDQPSIAVLPFQNMSGDPEQEYFSDGITEDIITALSHVNGLIVMARNSTFAYKGQSPDVRQVGRELGVRFVLEGSVRKAGQRVRITGQLIECQTGAHLWADRYDRQLDDIFALQDEITREITVALAASLTHGQELKLWADQAPDLEAWDLMMRGLSEQYKFTREGNLEAARLFRQAIALDPGFSSLKIGLGWALQSGARFGFLSDPAAASTEAQSLCDELLAGDNATADAHALQAYVFTCRGRFEDAKAHGRQAIALQPSVSLSHATLAVTHNCCGEFAAALNCMRKAIRLSPYCPDWYFTHLGDAYRGLGRLEQARTVYRHLETRMAGSILCQIRLAVSHADFNDLANASKAAEAVLSIDPQFSVRAYTASTAFGNDELRKSWADAMLKAGLPE
ncbi:adenylate/guanylate cyclase domain-containing protein [Leisingera sp. McT4-56]|uniref:adenylate/guanylate cyclase domain-containing protein n=1 Tax=Leisingera sp. McT4-56 TaxID=2881255 RepID=UPI001CF92CA2|nr:adenylate/guanylate cyclase domain-containing protein [Leisingera sp. McT4-56]MCB4458038.1 hypothetical protein [Leisingera sp. McT4-56]